MARMVPAPPEQYEPLFGADAPLNLRIYANEPELASALARRGIEADGNRLAYIVMWCELEAVICSGPMRGRQHTYALVEERVPAVVNRSRPLTERPRPSPAPRGSRHAQ